VIKELFDEIEKRFSADMSMTAGTFRTGAAKTVKRGQAIFIRPEEWVKFRRKHEKREADSANP
jgi:hypothetical protein